MCKVSSIIPHQSSTHVTVYRSPATNDLSRCGGDMLFPLSTLSKLVSNMYIHVCATSWEAASTFWSTILSAHTRMEPDSCRCISQRRVTFSDRAVWIIRRGLAPIVGRPIRSPIDPLRNQLDDTVNQYRLSRWRASSVGVGACLGDVGRHINNGACSAVIYVVFGCTGLGLKYSRIGV